MITYFELLTLISKGKPPRRVKYGNVVYKYEEEAGRLGWVYLSEEPINPGRVFPGEYIFLSENIIENHSDTDLVESKLIEVLESY